MHWIIVRRLGLVALVVAAVAGSMAAGMGPARTGPPGAPSITVPAKATIGQQASVKVAPSATGVLPARYVVQVNGGGPYSVPADPSGRATITIVPVRFVTQIAVTGVSAAGQFGTQSNALLDANPGPTAPDADLSGDGTADLLAVGGDGMPPGLWMAAGRGGGAVNIRPTDIAPSGPQGIGSPADFDGAQAISGHFAGSQFQDVLVYYPSGNVPGLAYILYGTGDASPISPIAPLGGQEANLNGLFSDFNGDNPLELANAGDTQGFGYPYPDLIGINGDPANGYYLDFFPDGDGVGNYGNFVQLDTRTPSGGTDWNNWQIATAQLASGTAMYLWDPSTGALYLWEGLHFDSFTSALAYTQYVIADGATTRWNQGAALTLHAADFSGNGAPGLWAVTGSGVVTAYLASLGTGTATLTGLPAQALLPPAHNWLSGLQSSPAPDLTGSPALPLTSSGNVSLNVDPVIGRDVVLDGTASSLATASAAVSPNAGGFTVSAWANPAALGGTVLSQDMTSTASFKLSATSDGEWSFCLATSDRASPGYDCATGGAARVGDWSHLTATYDPSTKVLALYLGTVKVAASRHAPLSGTTDGAFQVGDHLNGTFRAGYFNGQVADLQAWNQATPA